MAEINRDAQREPGERVVFPDGTVIFALHVDSRKPSDAPPDFGLYLDRGWSPEWNSIIIPWQDLQWSPA